VSQVELATGEFPYKNCRNDFEMLAKILDEDPPLLPPGQRFSMDFCNFVCRWYTGLCLIALCQTCFRLGEVSDGDAHTHTHPFNGLFSGTTQVSQYQKGKTNLDFSEARNSEWQWHQLGHMQVCTLLQTDNHASTPLLCFLQAGCPSCRPTNSVKALEAF